MINRDKDYEPTDLCRGCGQVHGELSPCGPRPEPDVQVPMPAQYGSPSCPSCGYRCGCCCHCSCQTPCPTPDEDGDCACEESCHGGHEPWDCWNWSTRYRWACAKSERLAKTMTDSGGAVTDNIPNGPDSDLIRFFQHVPDDIVNQLERVKARRMNGEGTEWDRDVLWEALVNLANHCLLVDRFDVCGCVGCGDDCQCPTCLAGEHWRWAYTDVLEALEVKDPLQPGDTSGDDDA